MIADIDGLELVGISGTYQDACRQMLRHLPEVMIVDIRLPDGNGLDLLRLIRRQREWRPTVIMFSNWSVEKVRRACMELGADHAFNKADEFHLLERELRILASLSDAQYG